VSKAHRELNNIRCIRNEFAHQFEINSFEREDIRDRCQELMLSQSKIVKAIRGEDGYSVVLTLGGFEKEREEEIPFAGFTFDTSPPSPRNRFGSRL
jgi:hypothetical protein